MGHTNQTLNYKFPLFIGQDKPSWMGDFNGAMTSLDKTIKEVSTIASGAGNDAANSIAIAEAASDLATAAHDAADANTKAIAEIIAGGIQPAPVAITANSSFETSEGIASRVGPQVLFNFKAKIKDRHSPVTPSKDFTLFDIPQSFDCTWENVPAENQFAGMAWFTITGGTRRNVALPILAKLIKLDGQYTWRVVYVDPADELANAARDATVIYVNASGSFNLIRIAPAGV